MKNLQPSRREREKLRQRYEMLAAALELFAEKGFHNVSMHEIAAKSEFAIGTLYKFFQNKEELYKALTLEQYEKFHDALVQAIETSDDEVEKLRNYVRTKSERFRSNMAFVRLYLSESRNIHFHIKAGMDQEVRKHYEGALEMLASIFNSGIQNKRFKAIASPYQMAVALDSVVNAFFLVWLEAPERNPFPEDPDTILNIFFQGLLEI